MIERFEASRGTFPAAVVSGGLALCPDCGRPLGEPISGRGRIAIWCRRCRKNVVVCFALAAGVERGIPS